MKLVVAEKPSVAQSLAAVLGAKVKKRRVSGRRRLAGVLVRGPIWWSWPSRKPMGSSTPNGGMRICLFFPPIGSMMWQRIEKAAWRPASFDGG